MSHEWGEESNNPEFLPWRMRPYGPSLHNLSGLSLHCCPTDYSTIVMLASLLFPISQTLSCHRAFAFTKCSFPQYLHGSLHHTFWVFTQLPPFQWNILWQPYLEFQQHPLLPNSSYPCFCSVFPHSTIQHAINVAFHHVQFLATPTRTSVPSGPRLLFYSVLCPQGLEQCLEYSRCLMNLCWMNEMNRKGLDPWHCEVAISPQAQREVDNHFKFTRTFSSVTANQYSSNTDMVFSLLGEVRWCCTTASCWTSRWCSSKKGKLVRPTGTTLKDLTF